KEPQARFASATTMADAFAAIVTEERSPELAATMEAPRPSPSSEITETLPGPAAAPGDAVERAPAGEMRTELVQPPQASAGAGRTRRVGVALVLALAAAVILIRIHPWSAAETAPPAGSTGSGAASAS